MRFRAQIAASLSCSMLALSVPRAARADERSEPAGEVAASEVTASEVSAVAPVDAGAPRIFLTRAEVLQRAYAPPSIGALPFAPSVAMKDIRLSSQAKTWIIIGAIVGGILLIVGVAVLATPGKKIIK